MAAEMDNNKKTFCRKPHPTLWTATLLVIAYAVWCVLLCILAASGHLLNSKSLECGNSDEDASKLKRKALLVYWWSGVSLPICILLLMSIWIRRLGSCLWFLSLCAICVLFVVMVVSLTKAWKKENEEIQAFEEHYLHLRPLRHTPGDLQTHFNDGKCNSSDNVYRWQTEFKCCGLINHSDWWPAIPDSCLCEGEDDSSECVLYGNSLVHEKPCLPTVLFLEEKRNSTFWIIMIVWLIIVGAPVSILMLFLMAMIMMCYYMFCFEPCWYKLSVWKYKLSGGEEMVPVVFIRKDNNDKTEEDNRKDGEAKESDSDEAVVLDVEDGKNVEGEGREAEEEYLDDNPMRMIPLSLLSRLQEELDPPPVQHQVRCMCIFPSKPKDFYIVTIEEDSPLLPSYAVLADANKPPNVCLWAEGHHVFVVEHIIWPRESKPQGTPPS
ncbi:uncharacterized protein LOC130163469 [Seriola aureovittata]|uniref:uncharacterized protein LOC130163469 n=1 Tax=Seriola aureovittata TaxID=2871759 RepID=UPI0024BE8417|nr:uncharacterized protein LOC130163469 [Seriola aureovittata]